MVHFDIQKSYTVIEEKKLSGRSFYSFIGYVNKDAVTKSYRKLNKMTSDCFEWREAANEPKGLEKNA